MQNIELLNFIDLKLEEKIVNNKKVICMELNKDYFINLVSNM